MYNKSDKIFLKQMGFRVMERRKKKKLTQKELARLTNLHETFIGMVERGQKNISISKLLKIANALEASVEYFVKCL